MKLINHTARILIANNGEPSTKASITEARDSVAAATKPQNVKGNIYIKVTSKAIVSSSKHVA